MEQSAAVLNTALEIVLQFGPERGRPAADRLREKSPTTGDLERADALSIAHAVEARAYELTEAGWPNGVGLGDGQLRAVSKQAAETLRREYPWITDHLLQHAISQAHYWHFHG